jgi:hypothetical protein
MIPFKAIPVTSPAVDIGLFRNVVSPEIVNTVDGKRNIQPLSKFAELVEESLLDNIDPYEHIYQTFYFELPVETFIHAVNMKLLSITAEQGGFITKGYMSASLAKWVKFVVDASIEDQSQYLRLFANQVYNSLRNFPPFQNLSFLSLKDKTFSLVKKDN